LLHQVGDLFELNVELRCQKINCNCTMQTASGRSLQDGRFITCVTRK